MIGAVRMCTAVLVCVASVTCGGTIDLSGSWNFAPDPNDVGVEARWFDRELPERLDLPGALQNQGFGLDVTAETEWTGSAKKEVWSKDGLSNPYQAQRLSNGNTLITEASGLLELDPEGKKVWHKTVSGVSRSHRF